MESARTLARLRVRGRGQGLTFGPPRESLFLTVGAMALLVLFVLYVVMTNNKLVASLLQMGDLQRREEVSREIVAAKKAPEPVAHVQPASLSQRISFTVGCVNLWTTAYVLGAVPTQFYLWHAPKAVVLITARWLDFKKNGQHYLLYDFCYWANGLLLLYLFVLPKSALLFQIVFLCANGAEAPRSLLVCVCMDLNPLIHRPSGVVCACV